jgi:hypothetical protein
MFDVFYSGPKPNLFAHERCVANLDEAKQLNSTRYFWWVNYLTDYSDHDFLWEPVPWEADQTHVWPSQHQPNGGTMLIPRTGGIEVNRKHHVLPRHRSVPRIGIDHGEGLTVDCEISTRYISDYLGTLRRILSRIDHEYVWVVSSVCNYENFDFTWHPSEWQQDMLHVFASDRQKFGDTFYVHVPSFLDKSKDIKLLEWFDTIHFVEDITVPRKPMPVIEHDSDTHVQAIRDHNFQTPLVMFSTGGRTGFEPTVCLWRELTKTVVPLTPGASVVIVPRETKNHMTQQVYDYPYIDKTWRTGQDSYMDIVFIDNGEPNAESNYQHLVQVASLTRQTRIHRSTGVTGRVAAYHAAARLSTTPWFFAVFAKLQVRMDFDWSWQPDRMQEPKHYIFHAFNPITGLTYGHQAMIAYNKKLVLDNPGVGLDFTLDSAHEVVPIVSGTAEYAHTPWMAWRTAFRECLKLKGQQDVESQYRLDKWLTVTKGQPYGQHSIWGAQDAVEYYDSVSGDLEQLRKSYDWAWLASYALIKRGLTPDQ